MKTFNFFNKLKWLLVPLVLITLGTGYAWGETWKWTASSGALGTTSPKDVTLNSKAWNITRSSVVYTGWSSSCIQFGSSSGAETVTLRSSDFSGTINSVYTECSSYNNAHKVSISVGGTSYLSSTATAKWTNISSKGGTGSSSGEIVITFTKGSRALYIKSITVDYTPAASCTTNPTVTAASNSLITSTTATVTCSSGISSLGSAGCSISSYGFVLNTTGTPTISDTKHQVGTTYTTTGTSFYKDLTGLSAETTYYVRPYATNGNGTAYGTQTSFTTSALPKYTVTLKDDNSTLTQASAGASVTLPSRTGCTGYTFAGWTKTWVAPQSSWTTTAPAIIPAESYTPEGDENLYPVYTKTESGGGPSDNYELYSGALTEGDYIIYYGGCAMNTTVSSDRLQYEEVTPSDDVITTTDVSIIWHIAQSGDYWTIYNTNEDAYAASTGAKNKAQMLDNGADDKSLWSVSGTSTYEFVNKKNTNNSVNANLRKNGTYGFACYATNTGGALSLYKNVTGGSTTSYISVPNCCTALGTINGSVKSTTGTSVTLQWDNIANVSSWTITCKNTSTGVTTGTVGAQSVVSTKKNCTITGLTEGTSYTFTITANPASGYCEKSDEVIVTTPKLTVTPTTITGLNYPVGSGPSEAQSFTVSGVGLTGNVTITAPTNFEVSKTSATSGFGSNVTLTPSSGTISATPIWVRLASGKTQGTYGPSNVTVSGGSATALNVSVTGVVSSACDDPTINTHPAAATYNLNATATALSVAATKNGTGPALTYQWYSNTANNNTTGSAIPSATSSTYTPPTTATGTKYYYCVVSSGACETATNTAAITVRTPSITVSKTSIAYGDQARGEGHTETFTVTGDNLASGQGLSLSISGANQAMFSVDKTSVVQTSAGAVATTTITVTYTPSSDGAHSATITVSSTGAESKTVALSGTGKWKVTWMKGGAEYTAGTPTTLVANSSKVTTLPTAPADNALGSCANKFMGWSAGNTPQVSAPADLFTTAANSPAITANTTFYAVYAQGSGGSGETNDVINYDAVKSFVLTSNSTWYDGEISCASGNKYQLHGMGGGSSSTYAFKWNTNGYLYGKSQASGMGTLSRVTIVTSSDKSINVYSNASAYKGVPSSTSLGSITATSSGATKDITSGQYIGLKGGETGIAVKSVTITYGSPATYSDYVTECCTDWAAPTLTYSVPSGWKSGSADVNATIGSGTTHGAVSFESSNTDVLTVNASTGKIHAVGAGTATVTATWAGDATYCEKSTTSATITVSGNVTVNFDKNGGSGTMTSQSIPYNTATALKANTFTAPTCKEFYGWADSQAKADAGTRDYTNGQSVTFTTGKTLYAVWKDKTYTVTKGSNTGASTFTLSPTTTITCGATLTITCAADGDHKGNPTVTATGTHGAITVVSATSVTIDNVQSDMTVNISYPAKEVYTITWMANGAELTGGALGSAPTSVTEDNAIGTLPTEPTSCDNETYTNFVGWYAFEAGSQSDPTQPATFTSTFGDKVSTSTVPTGNTTYYAVFSDGDPNGWSLVTSTDDLNETDEYTLGSKNSLENAELYMMGIWNNGNNIPGISYTAADFEEKVRTFQLITYSGYGDNAYAFYETKAEKYLYHAGGSSGNNNYLKLRATNSDGAGVWTVSINETSHIATMVANGGTSYNSNKYIRWNTSGMFSCYGSGLQKDAYLYKKGGVGTGYISSCGVNVKVTNGEQYITSANGIWTASNTITVEGQRLTSSGAANKRIVVSSSNSKFKIRAASTQDAGTASAVLPYSSPQTYITADSWTGTFEVTYTPTSANTTENTTITVKVCNQGSETALAQKTFTVYGRSLPDNFLIAVNDGTAADGHWYAIPADMIAPYGSTCTSGLGTYKPIPITVDNGANPTKATMAPARAVYQPAQRSTPRTSPQTLRFKSKTLSGSDTYYLYGGGTGGEGTTNNTHIQNAKFTDSEKQKWFLETSDLVTYNVHLATTISPNVLGYTTGAKRIGQYSATAGTTKKDIRFLPFDVSECVYIPAPEVTGVSLDDNYTIQFPKDRLATAWQISTDGGSNWVALPGKSEIACSGGVETPTTVQGVLPMSPYRGQTVKIKVSSPSSTCSTNIGEFVVPNPVITVNGATPWHLYGITGQAFDDQSQTITLSGLYEGAGAATNVTSSNPEITASLVAPVVNGDVHVLLTMTAGAATEGNHNTTLTFTSTGAEIKTRNVTITMQSLAPQSFTKLGGYFSGDILCTNADLSLSTTYVFQLTNPIYSAAGVVGVIGTVNSSNIYLYDVTTGKKVNGTTMSRAIDASGYAKFTIHNQIGDMVEGKKYRLEWTNTGQVCKNSSGVPYQDISYTFTYGDCSKPIALQPCPIGTTSFTANWIPSGSNSQSLDVYTKVISAGDVITDWDFTTTNPPAAVNTRFDLNPKDGNTMFQWGSFSGARRTDFQNYWRISNTSKHNDIYSASITTAGTYNIVADMRASTAQTVQVVLSRASAAYTDGYIRVIETFTIAAGEFKHIATSVTVSSSEASSGVKVGLVLGGDKITDIGHFSVIKQGAVSHVSGYPVSLASSINSREVTGLTAGTTYYYTVSNGSESNEVAVTTRSAAPTIDFSPGKAVLQTDVNGTVSTTVSLDGSNITLCELIGAIGGTNAAYFSADPSGLVYNQTTGAVSGDLVITYHPTATGNHTATYTIDGVSLELEGHACPAGYGNLATTATSVTNNSAQANWSTNTTGFLMVAENQRMNTELLINPGFEQDGLGWDGVPELFTPTSGSSHNEIKTALKRSGSNGLYVAYSQGGSFLYIGEGSGLYSGVYGAKQTLPAGTYTISAYVHGVSGSSALGNFASSDYHTMYVGFAVDYPTKYYSTSRKAIGSPTGTRINGQSTWVKVEDSFTLDEPTTGYIFIVNSTTLGANFALDDVSLKCTGIVAGNAFSEYPITSQKTYNLTGLKPSTSYSYYVVNGDGCESNIISFTTTASGAAPELEATPQPLVISGPKGSTAKSTVSITAKNAYSNILLSVGDACGGRISISPTSLSSNGGLVTVSFTPLDGDAEGDKGSCTISATTLGIAATYDITVNWNVTAGVDVNTPTIEVVTITNSTMDIEHNIEKVSENSEIRIQLDRELTPEEIEENVGDEIFFSKYYEAFMHKKLWAIYNPTNEKISLKGMQVWRSAGGSAGDKSEWNRTDVVDLANYGQEKGFIGPKEEIIIYASQNTYTCEQNRTDMSGWFGYPNSGPLSYSGDDALLLVRKVRTGEADYRTPPAESVEWNDNNDHSKGHVALSWRTIVDDDDTEWTMLDIIGARAKNNMPDGSAIRGWSWKNCKNSNATESGDDKGWIGYGYDLTHENLNYYDCSALNGANGYLLSTNRCLLIRLYTVKSGNNAVAVNVGDMFTLGKGGVQPEWKGAHVPTDPSSEQDRISCENFSFVGGYDYSNYYNSWTPLTEGGDYLVGPRNPDGSYTIENMNVPRYWCNKIRIELIEHETVNGVDVDNLRHYQDYKVPIVVDENAQTNTTKFFGNPNNPSYSGAEENPKKGEWSTVCADCDVVVNNNSKLTHVAAGKQQFHNMQLYAGAKLDVADNLTMTLNALQLRADNNNVSYAIINNGKASITVDSIIHVKRIDDAHWYRFSLPYDCDIASIRQLNGKSMGTYDYDGVNDNLGTWVIKEYDGKERQEMDDFAGAGNSSRHWKPVAGTATLQKHKGYIIGLYETEWAGQHKQVYFPPKNPNATYGYTEGANDTKTANVYSWAVNKDAGDQMNHGWNFVGLPFISVFNPAHTGLAATQQGVNNSTVMIKGKFDDQYADQDNVYVSVPTDDGMKYYEQNLASTQKLEPFLAYFVQVKDPTGSVDETKEIVYAKAGRELSLAPRRISTSAADDNIRINLDVLFVADSTNFDKTGILISNDYTTEYEIGYDLIKMNRANNTAKIHSIATDNTPMAYNALPVDAANYIPLSLYAPAAGDYNISISKQSDLTNVKAAYLLYNSEQVANLKFEDYTLTTQQTGNINGYALKIVLDNKIATSTYDISTEGLIVNTAYGKIELIGVADGAEVSLVDVLGHVISTQHSTDGTVVFDIWVPGVYQLIIRTDSGIKVVKTMMK